MRGVLCDSKYEELLAQFAKTSKLSIGLIIGQIGKSGKDLVVHLAKTQHSEQKAEPDEEQMTGDELTKVSDIKNSIVAEHALNAIRMIVGGFNILGLFVVSENILMSDNGALQKIKTILMDIKSTLNSNGILYASTDQFDNGDKIFLNYVASHKNFICKTISTDPSKAANVSPVDWKFVSKSMEFFEFETTYEIATTFPLKHTTNQFDTEKYVMGTIDKIAGNLAKSIMFFNGEPCEAELTVEKFVKNFANEDSSKIKVTIYSDAAATPFATSENGILTPQESLISYTGIITSRVYAASRNTIAEVEGFIHNDIIRSITTRLQIYYDAFLANDDGGNDDEEEKDREVNSTCPPRRVFFPIGNSSITFCDYLFQNENEETTVKQSMEILGIELDLQEVDSSAEAAIQYTVSEKTDSDNSNAGGGVEEATKLAVKDSGKMIIIFGIVGIVVALIASVILQFLMN
ncbi:hypothetical protein PVAND_010483 [Polypedilum vanderplanki]|uniref:Uncharacterized protein n=1 Tax=Polypedilum vanderplanki TaxID=319348 RepID=A0A9J6CFQ0_POLVA|nr:hypothetical protein PVAND_010483 [Polypedilum vanderplanki]